MKEIMKHRLAIVIDLLNADIVDTLSLIESFRSKLRIGSALFLSMIFPDSIAAITYSSLGLNSNKYAPTSESYIRDKYGLRSNLQSCLTKLSNPKGMDCKGRDKGCCLLIKLSVQRKSAMKKLNRPENKVNTIEMIC